MPSSSSTSASSSTYRWNTANPWKTIIAASSSSKTHEAIVKRFGRYPHRNETLGRASTPEETKFLKEPGSSF